MKKTPPARFLLLKDQGTMLPLSGVPAERYQQSLSRCITCQDVCVQQSHASKRLLSSVANPSYNEYTKSNLKIGL